jgi:hypothetical protein
MTPFSSQLLSDLAESGSRISRFRALHGPIHSGFSLINCESVDLTCRFKPTDFSTFDPQTY